MMLSRIKLAEELREVGIENGWSDPAIPWDKLPSSRRRGWYRIADFVIARVNVLMRQERARSKKRTGIVITGQTYDATKAAR